MSSNDDLGFELPAPAKSSRTRVVAVFAIVVAGAFVFGYTQHHKARGATPTTADAAGMTRLRPVMMTALAMVIGMIPMALGLGDGGEQNAPLGRAVIGGLSLATLTTLFFVPVMYSLLRRKAPTHE